jgi:hypothetical protein
MDKDKMLELIKKDRPGQVIHEVVDFRPHPLEKFGVKYEVDVVMEGQVFETKIREINLTIPYPLQPYIDFTKAMGGNLDEEDEQDDL